MGGWRLGHLHWDKTEEGVWDSFKELEPDAAGLGEPFQSFELEVRTSELCLD